MRITWYGHAAFLIETARLRIILDPFRSPDSGGYEPIAEAADLVVVSHENDRYHSHLGQIVLRLKSSAHSKSTPGAPTSAASAFEAIQVFETPERLPEDEVTIVHFRCEDLHVVFLGDLGHRLSEAELAPLRGADIVTRRRRRTAHDRLSRNTSPPGCNRPANRRAHALQDAQDQSQHPAAGTISGSAAWRSHRAARSFLVRHHAGDAASRATIMVLTHAR